MDGLLAEFKGFKTSPRNKTTAPPFQSTDTLIFAVEIRDFLKAGSSRQRNISHLLIQSPSLLHMVKSLRKTLGAVEHKESYRVLHTIPCPNMRLP